MSYLDLLLHGPAEPAALCVPTNDRARCQTIQQLVRPEEVSHLFDPYKVLVGMYTPQGIAEYFRRQFATRYFRFVDDPAWCDRWSTPRRTLRTGTGDCDDLAILALAMLRYIDVHSYIVVGDLSGNGHAWIEGEDSAGFFLIEATTGALIRHRPNHYRARIYAAPGWCTLVSA